MAHHFNQEHQRSQCRSRSDELLVIVEFVMANPLELVVEKSNYGAAERYRHTRGWRFEPGNQAKQIGEQDEKPDRHRIGNIALVVVSDDPVSLFTDEILSHLK